MNNEVYTKLHIGYQERLVSATEIRNAQGASLKGTTSKNDVALIDAIIAHFVCGRPTVWKGK